MLDPCVAEERIAGNGHCQLTIAGIADCELVSTIHRGLFQTNARKAHDEFEDEFIVATDAIPN